MTIIFKAPILFQIEAGDATYLFGPRDFTAFVDSVSARVTVQK